MTPAPKTIQWPFYIKEKSTVCKNLIDDIFSIEDEILKIRKKLLKIQKHEVKTYLTINLNELYKEEKRKKKLLFILDEQLTNTVLMIQSDQNKVIHDNSPTMLLRL